jgi:ATP adenylyltransferase
VASDRIWAPWRLEYIKGDKANQCILCALPAEGDDRASLIVHRGERCFVILNAYPYTNGHVMVAPFEHTARLDELDSAAAAEMMHLAQQSLRALERAYGPEGYNVGANLGAVAGAGVEDHVHLHVVPRWKGDTNFMPVLGDVRVLPQSLEDSWKELRAAFEALHELEEGKS